MSRCRKPRTAPTCGAATTRWAPPRRCGRRRRGPRRRAEPRACPPAPAELISGRPDLNRGPHRPERCALPGCATPRIDPSIPQPSGAAPGALLRGAYLERTPEATDGMGARSECATAPAPEVADDDDDGLDCDIDP